MEVSSLNVSTQLWCCSITAGMKMSFICLIWGGGDGGGGLALLVWQTRLATTTPRIHRLFFFFLFFFLSAHTCHHVTSPDPTYPQHHPAQALPHTWHPNNGHDDLPEQTRVQATTLRARRPQQRPLPAILYLTRSKPRLAKSRTSRTQWLNTVGILKNSPRAFGISDVGLLITIVEAWKPGQWKLWLSCEQHPNE